MSKEDKKSLFEEAAKESLNDILKPRELPEIKQQQEMQEEALEIVNSQWGKLTSKMDGEYAERFMRELEASSGRDYMRNYLKMLEYVKPKLTRQELGAKDQTEDLVLTIHVKQSKHNYDSKMVDIDHEEIESEKDEDDARD